MKNDIKFSIIVPVYNIEKYIEKCLDSIVNQSYINIEIILVNDGSKDGSPTILKKYAEKDQRIVLVDKENGGLSSARNAGIDVSTGDYISFIDGDDWVSTELYKTVAEQIDQHGEVDLLTYSFYNYYGSTEDMVVFSYKSTDCLNGKEFYEKSNYYVNAWSKIYKAKTLKAKDFRFIKGIVHEDIPFTILYTIGSESVVNINTPFYYYRRNRADSILNTLNEKSLRDKAFIVAYLIDKSREMNYTYTYFNDKIFLYWLSLSKAVKYPVASLITFYADAHILQKIATIVTHSSYRHSVSGFLAKYSPTFAIRCNYWGHVLKFWLKKIILK
ncbi:MAG: glycosyltransferase [Paludibacteraceae bacterium]